jgi:hypothetical protein
VLLIAFACGPPLLLYVLRRLPSARRLALLGLVGLATVVIDVNLSFHPSYRGMSRGFDIGLLDIYALGLLFFLASQARRVGFSWLPPRKPGVTSPVVAVPHALPALLAFAAWAAVTLIVARVPLFGAMDLAKLVRGIVLFWIVVNLVRDEGMAREIPLYIAVFVGIECAMVAMQHLRGVYMPSGTFEHKNSLELALNLVLPVLLMQALSGRRRQLLMLLLYGGGALAVILSRSRTGWFTLAAVSVIVVAYSLVRSFLAHSRGRLRLQMAVLALMGALAVPVLAKSADGIVERFSSDAEISMDFRHRNNAIATELVAEHPFGVGLNNYVVELDGPLGRTLDPVDRTVAHHLYLLVAAETGLIGLSLLVVAFLVFILLGMRTAFAGRTDHARDISFALLLGFAAALIHSFMESDLLRGHTWFVTCIVLGMLVALHQREGLMGVRGALSAVTSGGRSLRRALQPAAFDNQR